MSVLYILVGLSILLALIFLVAFIRAVKGGQFDDGHTPAMRMLFEEESQKE